MPNRHWYIRRDLRQRFAAQQGFLSYPTNNGYHVVPIPVISRKKLKTSRMRILERQHKKSIEWLLLNGHVLDVASDLEVTIGTVREWITYLNLQYTEKKLPSCTNCRWEVRTCRPMSETREYPLSCRILKLTKQQVLHDLKVKELRS